MVEAHNLIKSYHICANELFFLVGYDGEWRINQNSVVPSGIQS